MTEFIKELLHILLYSLLVGAVPIAMKLLSNLVDLKQRELISGVESEQVKTKLNAAIDLVQTVVLEVAQTYVDPLKEIGEFTVDAADSAKASAIHRAKALLSTEGVALITDMYGDFDLWLDTHVEAAVKKINIQ